MLGPLLPGGSDYFRPSNPILTYLILPLLMDRTLLPYPWRGSVLTSLREDPEMWECGYCSAVLPVESLFLERGLA
jgi:hypothetical protein